MTAPHFGVNQIVTFDKNAVVELLSEVGVKML